MGKYGILHIVNRKNNSPAYSYPVDSERTTFGRDDGCDIRLLYGWVSGLHCKLFFQNAKAFLTIYGLNGVIVDGCHIARNPDADGESSETTIPIMNNSQIEIYRKRFVFEYPSKELRAKARVEPATVKPRRTLRLSMIQSAQVFTPSKPSDAQTPKSHRRRRSETLAEQLQSPIKPFSPARPTPGANMGHETLSAAEEEREVTLVGARGAQSVVVLEEEKDLVVVEAMGDDSDDEDLSDEEEIIKNKENENPFDVGRSSAQSSAAPLAAPSPSPAAQHSFTATVPRRAFTSPYTPNRPTLSRSSASVPVPAPPLAPAVPQQPVRTPARRARFSLHKAVLLRSAQRQLIERERLNQLQAREPTIFDEDGDAEMADMDPEFVEEPDSEPSETMGDTKVDLHLASEVRQLAVEDAEAEEEDAVEAAVSPVRPRTDHGANGSFSDDSERSLSDGDVSLAESEESDISEEHEQEEIGTPLGARIQNSISSLGSFLPSLLRSPAKAVDEAEVEEDIVDQVAPKNRASGPSVVKVEPEEEEDAHEVLRFGSDSDNEEELDEPEANKELGGTPEPEEPSGSDEDDVYTPTELEAARVDVRDGQTVKDEPAGYFEDEVESTPIQPRRLQNVFMTPQVTRPNFPRLAAGRKSVAVATPGSAVGDVSWLPGRVPVSTQHVDSDEEEETEFVQEEAVEEVPVTAVESKHVPELGFEEKAARRQSALAVMAAGPRQLPNRRQSVAPHLVKSEPLDTNNRRVTLAAAALAPVPGTPQHASTLAQSSETAVADDSSDEEAPPEKPLDTLRKKIDYMRRQSMHRAARESPIGPLFGDMPSESTSSDVKLEDSEGIEACKTEDAQEPEESEKELDEESEEEVEVLAEEEEDQVVTQSEAETETEAEELVVPGASDAESEAVSDHGDAQDEPEDVTVVAPLPIGPSTPALKGVRALFRAAEVKGLGAQTPAGLDGMLDMFGPEFEPEPEPEPELVVEADIKPTRLRTKSANPTRLKAPTATGMARVKSAQTASEAARSAKAPEPAASRTGARSLREPTKLPSRVQTPVEDPEPSAVRAFTRKATGSTVSVVLPHRAKVAKEEPSVEAAEEPAPVESKMKAPSKRITRTASAASNTAESKRVTRTASSTSTGSRTARATGRTTPLVPEEPAKPAARSTRTKATIASSLPARSKAATPPARVTTPVAATDDDQDPMDIMTMPESPTKRSTRAKAVKAEPEEDEVAHVTRSRTKSGESEAAKGKRTTSRRVASKATEENKENTAVEAPEVETESKVKPSGLPTKTTRKTATTSKLVAPSKIATKAEPAAASTTARALRTRARK
ncbi:hypothetical protein FRC10_008611 [Ceratobasidium sp. 414]|nr:hypothetical protein FRC10_008611 [Ceratobasidium sp. 414]